MNCPQCSNVTLEKELYEGIEIDRCHTCSGIWLDEGELGDINWIEQVKIDRKIIEDTIKNASPGVPTKDKERNLSCPHCNETMHAFNFQYDSGVIIDRCRGGHGIWLDKGEIERIQAYSENWEKELKANDVDIQRLLDQVHSEHQKKQKEHGSGLFRLLVRFFYRL